MTLIFFSLSFILNLFEEINFFKDYKVGVDVPILMSLLFIPNLVFNMFPFIILLSGIWFFLKIKKTDEIIALKAAGLSNLSVLSVPSFLSIVIGIFFITSLSPITSALVKKYESIKNTYEKEQESLASVTVNGIWIKEKNFIIQSSSLDNKNLKNLTIYEFDDNFIFLKRIEADEADITNKTWILKNPIIINENGKKLHYEDEVFYYDSFYNVDKIISLYSNLDTVSFWDIKKEIKILEERGYSTNDMRAKMQRSLAFPFFLLGMVLLSGVFTLSSNFRESNWTYVFLSIITSVLVFYLNDFSAALGKTDKLPVELSVWMPILIIFIFNTVGIIHANQK